MVSFEDNELEIAIATYNRRDFVEEWLRLCYEDVVKRNISLSIYDSSTNTETEDFIKEFNKAHKKVKYVKVPSETEVGYKPMLPILESTAKYLWVSGDSRYHDFSEMDEKVFPLIKKGIDYIAFYWGQKKENFGTVFTDKSSFLREAFVSVTCIGCSIYRLEMFSELKEDKNWMRECDEKYRYNYGFGWIGYFFETFARNGSTAALSKIEIKDIFPKRKKQAWASRFYECWVENLIDLMDKLPELYTTKQDVPRNTWNEMKLDSYECCNRARVCGGLNLEVFEKYINNGMLKKVSDRIRRIRFYACAPMWQVEMVSFLVQGFSKLRKAFRKLIKYCG